MNPITLTILGQPDEIARFSANVSVDSTGCWLWTGDLWSRSPGQDYGRMHFRGRQHRAHRVSWMLHRGSTPGRLHVLHRCDVPRCVNPAHLFLGTNLDNVADRVRKGRSGRAPHPGDQHPMRKLSEAQVRAIRQRLTEGERGCDLAAEFGVSRPTITDIKTGRKWRACT